jgi:hypothetical protein
MGKKILKFRRFALHSLAIAEHVAETFVAVAIILDSTRNGCGHIFHRAGPSENRAKI